MNERAAKIAAFNDALRQNLRGGKLMLTAGVQALTEATVIGAMGAVRDFNSFTDDNDPHGEHDFGSIEVDGHKFFWKIDAYDIRLEYGSPDPSDDSVTTRVLTLMLAEEY